MAHFAEEIEDNQAAEDDVDSGSMFSWVPKWYVDFRVVPPPSQFFAVV